jgi:hypothetical protein
MPEGAPHMPTADDHNRPSVAVTGCPRRPWPHHNLTEFI